MSKRAKPPVPVGPHRIGEQFVAQPPTLCLKTAQGERHVIGKIEQLTPAKPLAQPNPARFRMLVSMDLYADAEGHVLLPKWKWTLVLPKSGKPRALSPGYFDSEAEAERNAWGFTLFLAEHCRPETVEVLV